MKLLNKTSFGIFEKLIALLGENHHVKIDNASGVFMPLSIERVGTCSAGQLISLAHYYEQNGDLMADPEMVFVYQSGKYAYATSYKHDGLGKYQESVFFDNGEPSRFHPSVQADHTYFANQWLKNIKSQQGIR